MELRMTKTQRIALLALALGGAVLALVLAKPDEQQSRTETTVGGAPTTSTGKAKQAPATTTKTSKTTKTTPTKQEPVTAYIRLRGGEPLGGPRLISTRVGDRVAIAVRSKLDDQVHVHGYGVRRDVGGGKIVLVRFTARIPGVFEIELERTGVLIARLEVRP